MKIEKIAMNVMNLKRNEKTLKKKKMRMKMSLKCMSVCDCVKKCENEK